MPTTKQTLAALAAAALASTTPFALAGAVDRDDTSTDEVDETFVIEDEQGTDDDGTVLLTLEAETDEVDTEEETDLEGHEDGETFGAWVSSLPQDKTWYEDQGYRNKGQYVSEHARARNTEEAEPGDTKAEADPDATEEESEAPEDTQVPEDVDGDDAAEETDAGAPRNGNGNGGHGGNGGVEDDAEDDLDDDDADLDEDDVDDED